MTDLVMITPNDDTWYKLNDLPNEEWKDIKGFERLYKISNYGRVKSYHNKNNIILHPGKNSEHRYIVILCKNKHFTKKVHRLVGESFIPNPENKPEINHINPVTKDLCDNRVCNLEWCTSMENWSHAEKVTGHSKPPISYGINNNAHHSVVRINLDNNEIKLFECVREVCDSIGIDRHKLRHNILQGIPINDYLYVYEEMWKRGDEIASNIIKRDNN